jgi:acetyl-CoA synthetase
MGTTSTYINVLFSSGTTGTPKIIPWTHLTPIKSAMDGRFHQDIHSDDVVAWPTNIGWMMGPWLIFASLINNATMALFEGSPLDLGFIEFVRQVRITILGVIPSLVRVWRSAGFLKESDWDHMHCFSSTGEPSNFDDYLWLISRTGYRAPVIEYLGGTEIGGGHITGSIIKPCHPATFNSPALGLDFILLNDMDKPVKEKESGELYIVPPSIGLSQKLVNKNHDDIYFNNCPGGPDGETLRRHGDRFLKLPGGFYKAHGRSDDTMNLGGIKVSSIELEQVVAKHKSIQESAAVSVQPLEGGQERLLIFAVLSDQIEIAALKKELNVLLAKILNPLFKISELVIVDNLPRTASNKLMRRKLRASYQTNQNQKRDESDKQ